MKTLIIGYGYMGQIRKAVVDTMPELKLMGVCDPNLSSRQIDFDCPHYKNYTEAIKQTQPDIVFVCTPNQFSPDICIYALEQGSHVFCEKPPGRNLVDIQRIIIAEQTHPGQKVMFGFNHRHHLAILEAKSIVKAGRMGRIMWLRGLYGKSGGSNQGFEQSWRNDLDISGGGILLDQGIHMLDLFRFFCGDFQEIHSMLTTAYWNIHVEDNAFVLLRNNQGQIAQLHSSATFWKHTFRLEIGLEGGYLIIQGLLSKSGSYGRETLIIGRKPKLYEDIAVGNPREETVYFDKDLSWQVQVQEFITCIKTDRPISDSSTLDALEVMQIINTVYQQANVDYAIFEPVLEKDTI